MKLYDRLLCYKKEHGGSTCVPQNEYGSRLGRWVHKQRYHYHSGNLNTKRISLLESIGFQWQLVNKTAWTKMYRRLEAYITKYKNARVPREYKLDPQLGTWVHHQRHSCKEKYRIDLLNKIGFEWRLRGKNIEWEVMYQRLLTYKKRNGTACVPTEYKADTQLGGWVSRQRYRCEKKYRIDLLNDIGFVWDVRGSKFTIY